MSLYRTVNYLAYRVSVSTSAARNYAREAGSLAREACKLDTGGDSDHSALLVPEIRAQAAHAEAAATRAQAALDRCWPKAREDPQGPVFRVSDGSPLLFPEDHGTRATIAESLRHATAGRAEAHLALDIVKALYAELMGYGP
jgi:hypothetical protein